jgi:hypothetical protein
MFEVVVIEDPAAATVSLDPSRSPDQLSARWLLALAARLVRDVGALISGAANANRPVATFAIEGRGSPRRPTAQRSPRN